MRLLVTGGAGFVGASLALAFKRAHPGATVVVLDNLRRRGSEQNIARLGAAGIRFVRSWTSWPGCRRRRSPLARSGRPKKGGSSLSTPGLARPPRLHRGQ